METPWVGDFFKTLMSSRSSYFNEGYFLINLFACFSKTDIDFTLKFIQEVFRIAYFFLACANEFHLVYGFLQVFHQ